MTPHPASDPTRRFTIEQRNRAHHFTCEGVPLHSFGAQVAQVGAYLFSGIAPIAAGRDNLDALRAILGEVTHPGRRDIQQALHIAHYFGREGVVAFLASQGVRAELRGEKPLYTRADESEEVGVRKVGFDGAEAEFSRVILTSRGARHPNLAQRAELPLSNLLLIGVGLRDYDAVAGLLAAGLYSPDARDGEWHSVSLAAFLGEVEAIRLLKGWGANINYASRRCRPAIHHAVRNHDAATLMALLELGADPNLPDPLAHGKHPLHVAADRTSEEPVDVLIAELLLEAGARKHARWVSSNKSSSTNGGATPFELLGKGCVRLRKLLQLRGG